MIFDEKNTAEKGGEQEQKLPGGSSVRAQNKPDVC